MENVAYKDDTSMEISIANDISAATSPGISKEDDHLYKSKIIFALRVIVSFVLIAAAAILGGLSYKYLHDAETVVAENNFYSAFARLQESIPLGLQLKGVAGQELASLFSYTFNSSNSVHPGAQFPFVTMNGFDEIVKNHILLASARSASFNPYITPSTRAAWESYAKNNVNLLVSSPLVDTYFGPNAVWPTKQGMYMKVATASGGKVNKNDTQDTTAYGSPYPYAAFPVWQIAPLATNYKAVMYDLHSELYRCKALDNAIQTATPAITDVLQLVQDTITRPSAIVFTPIYSLPQVPNGHFQEGTPSSAKTIDNLVGMTSIVFSWDDVLANTLPNFLKGLDCVMSTSTFTFTYSLTEGTVILRGVGDLHDTKYDQYKSTVTGSLSGTVYTFTLYPSKEFFDTYYTSKPMNATIGVVLIITFTAALFVFYDYLVQQKATALFLKLKGANDILDELFPAFIRSRLFTRSRRELDTDSDAEDQNPSAFRESLFPCSSKDTTDADANYLGSFSNYMKKSQRRLGASKQYDLIRGKHGEDVLDASSQIAESFECVTILFADIAGFTQWSSGKKPQVVFALLEMLFGAFDARAKARGVFKVETIGDCYMAVTGIPDQNEDHAEVMADFALDINDAFNHILARKRFIDAGGEKVGFAELRIRIGFHSGPCTAGVLRNDRARFQLFGDTVNVSSRAESTGLPGRIQVTSDAARLLFKAPPGKFNLEERDTLVDAKGKGKMKTYWLTRPTQVCEKHIPHDRNDASTQEPSCPPIGKVDNLPMTTIEGGDFI